jgi:hypothetical protein
LQLPRGGDVGAWEPVGWQADVRTKYVPIYHLKVRCSLTSFFFARRYWGVYGQLLYTYSYNSDKYSHTHNASDLAAVRALIPAAAESAARGRQTRHIGPLASRVNPSRKTQLSALFRAPHALPVVAAAG